MARPSTIYVWANRYDPHIIGSFVAASSGKIASVRTTVTGTTGKFMLIRFRLASAADVLAIKNALESYTPSSGTWSCGKTVIAASAGALEYENEIIKDGSVDITDSIPAEFDYWKGTIKVLATS